MECIIVSTGIVLHLDGVIPAEYSPSKLPT